MAKAVFICKVNPSYDDLPEFRYHFPRTYLAKAQEAIGDWVLYYESRRDGGRQVYFATARVTRIEPDPIVPDHFYAFVEHYLEFPSPVPWRQADGSCLETALLLPDGRVNVGIFQRSVHHIPEHEYQMIVAAGMAPALPRLAPGLLPADEPVSDETRPVVERLLLRPYRDRAFTDVVRSAYDSTCALTGLRLINGGGRCEIEAAHIRAVQERGPDSPRNGIALSRTVHWLFDRHLVALEDDGRILTADKLIPEQLQGMFNRDGYARFPERENLKPHPQFLRFHREQFKG